MTKLHAVVRKTFAGHAKGGYPGRICDGECLLRYAIDVNNPNPINREKR